MQHALGMAQAEAAALRRRVEELLKSNQELVKSNDLLSEQLRLAKQESDPPNVLTPPPSRAGKVNELRAIRKRPHERARNQHLSASALAELEVWTSAADISAEDPALVSSEAPPAKPKPKEQVKRIVAALSKKAPFDTFEEAQLNSIADAMTPLQAKAQAVLVTEGDQGQHCYLLDSGELCVKVKGVEKDRIRAGQIFGELALMYNVPRTATIEVVSDASLFVLDRLAFRRTIRLDTVTRRREIFFFLRTCKTFDALDDRAIYRVADVVVEQTFDEGAMIIKEGTECNDDPCMYFLKEGSVVVKQAIPEENRDSSGKTERLVGILKSGDYFGERALITQEPRSCSIEAVSPTICLRVDRDAFKCMLDPLHEEMKKAMPVDSSPTWLKKSGKGDGASLSAKDASQSVRQYSPAKTNIAILKPLGSGGFARVLLAKDSATRRLFAMKVIHKSKLLERKADTRTAQILSEKLALSTFSHPFITGLHAHYQDSKYLYLLIELALGGDLFGLMDRHGLMSEPMARFYVSSLALALEHLHLLEFVYRDLKPENVLLDSRGFVKLCDFGFAKKLTLDRTYSQCGTPDYVAPEMLNGQGVNHGCDWWALGVMIFEMIVGNPAFTDMSGDTMKTFSNILKGDLQFPRETTFSASCKALVAGMLSVNLASRLGYAYGGANSVLSHAWFEDVDWDRLVNCYIEPPWRPKLMSATDTSHFELEEGASNFGEDDELTPQDEKTWEHVWKAWGSSEGTEGATEATFALPTTAA